MVICASAPEVAHEKSFPFPSARAVRVAAGRGTCAHPRGRAGNSAQTLRQAAGDRSSGGQPIDAVLGGYGGDLTLGPHIVCPMSNAPHSTTLLDHTPCHHPQPTPTT